MNKLFFLSLFFLTACATQKPIHSYAETTNYKDLVRNIVVCLDEGDGNSYIIIKRESQAHGTQPLEVFCHMEELND